MAEITLVLCISLFYVLHAQGTESAFQASASYPHLEL